MSMVRCTFSILIRMSLALKMSRRGHDRLKQCEMSRDTIAARIR